jgi:hypothetical protein
MKLGPRLRPWTPAETNNFWRCSIREWTRMIARRLKRTVQAVRTRKHVLNKRRLVELGLNAARGKSK